MGNKILKVTARISDDLGCLEGTFDAAEWFCVADDLELRRLHEVDYRNSYEADAVAEFCAGVHEKDVGYDGSAAADVLELCHLLSASAHSTSKGGVGYNVVIDPEEAHAWLRKYRPALAMELL